MPLSTRAALLLIDFISAMDLEGGLHGGRQADERPAWALDIVQKSMDAGIGPSSTLPLADRLSNEEA